MNLKKRRNKKIIKRIITFLIVLVILALGYMAYVILSYERINDMLYLDENMAGEYSYFGEDSNILATDKAYNIMTYNIGFGASTNDFSFFMDGGKKSRADSEEKLMANICEIANVINMTNPDFFILQEIDLDGTRSYHVNELDLLNEFIRGYYYNYAVNYDSAFLPYPILEPHGANKSSLATYSRASISQAVRRQLPIATDLTKFLDLDRCYTVSKIMTDKEKYLCIYNVHLSAYSKDRDMQDEQIKMLFEDMEKEYKAGNYIICGGDFNHNLKKESANEDLSWTHDFPRDLIPKGFGLALDNASSQSVEHNSCRNLNEPYNEETTFTITVDGFIVSDNIRVNYYTNAIWDYEFSDHDPVVMQFFFK